MDTPIESAPELSLLNAQAGLSRRTLLQVLAGAGAATLFPAGPARAAAKPPTANGKAGDFDFLTGNWKIKNRRRKGKEWDEFNGEATVTAILGGLVSIEELRIPERNFSGMGLRVLDVEKKLWADYFVNSKVGVLHPQPAWGSFENGIGRWDSDETDDGKPIIVRGIWDEITPKSCRWYQAASRDDGQTWEESWVMRWTRA